MFLELILVVPARSSISKTEVKFSSSLDFIDPEHIYRIFDPDEPVYVGKGMAEIDRAWDELILREWATLVGLRGILLTERKRRIFISQMKRRIGWR